MLKSVTTIELNGPLLSLYMYNSMVATPRWLSSSKNHRNSKNIRSKQESSVNSPNGPGKKLLVSLEE